MNSHDETAAPGAPSQDLADTLLSIDIDKIQALEDIHAIEHLIAEAVRLEEAIRDHKKLEPHKKDALIGKITLAIKKLQKDPRFTIAAQEILSFIEFELYRHSNPLQNYIYRVTGPKRMTVLGLAMFLLFLLAILPSGEQPLGETAIGRYITAIFSDSKPHINVVVISAFLGSVVSIFSQLRGPKLWPRRNLLSAFLNGLLRPTTGMIFGILSCAIIASEFVPLEVAQGKEPSVYAVVAFLTGFSERFAGRLFGGAEKATFKRAQRSRDTG